MVKRFFVDVFVDVFDLIYFVFLFFFGGGLFFWGGEVMLLCYNCFLRARRGLLITGLFACLFL